MFYEPARSPYDWNLKLLGIPVRVQPMFWVLAIFLGLGGRGDARTLILWVATVFASILIHEAGHALAMRFYGFSPRIVLYSFGGLTISDRSQRLLWYENIFISFAGPFAGFLFLASVMMLYFLAGVHDVWYLIPGILGINVPFPSITNSASALLLLDLTFVNLFWGILNLLPIFPLDGGQITREFLQWVSPYQGFFWALRVSFLCSALLTFYFLFTRQYFAAMMFGMIAFSNMQLFKMYRR